MYDESVREQTTVTDSIRPVLYVFEFIWSVWIELLIVGCWDFTGIFRNTIQLLLWCPKGVCSTSRGKVMVSTPKPSDDLISGILGVQSCCASLHHGCHVGPQMLWNPKARSWHFSLDHIIDCSRQELVKVFFTPFQSGLEYPIQEHSEIKLRLEV